MNITQLRQLTHLSTRTYKHLIMSKIKAISFYIREFI